MLRLGLTSLPLIWVLFGVAAAMAAPSTDPSYVVSLRRLTEQEYRNSIADIFGKEIEVRGTFEPAAGNREIPGNTATQSMKA